MLLYLMVIAIKIFGYNLFAVRLPMIIISIISMFFFYDLAKRITKKETTSLIALRTCCNMPLAHITVNLGIRLQYVSTLFNNCNRLTFNRFIKQKNTIYINDNIWNNFILLWRCNILCTIIFASSCHLFIKEKIYKQKRHNNLYINIHNSCNANNNNVCN